MKDPSDREIDLEVDATGAYTIRRAFETDAFHQFPLLDPVRLRREAAERGIRLPIDPYDHLERLDEAGAFCPLLFDAEEIVYRDELDFVRWEHYAVDDPIRTKPRAQPRYSPWQLLYLKEAMKLDKAEVPAEWLLDDARWEKGREQLQGWYAHRLEAWHGLDVSWRSVILVLFRIQGRYGPSIKGSLTKATTTVVYDDATGEYVDPLELEPPWDAGAVLTGLGMTAEQIKNMYENIAMRAINADPVSKWFMLFRMAPFKQRARLQGNARLAQDGYDAALMLRRFYFDVTGELLLAPDEIFDVSDKSWKKKLFGRWPMERFTREDLAVELRLRQLNPHEVHLVVEGETENLVCTIVMEEIGGMKLGEMGVSMQRLDGVGNLRRDALRAVKHFPRFLVLIADREGDMEREAGRLIDEGVLTKDAVQLWDSSFEEANFSDVELLGMIGELGRRSGATLSLDADILRSRYEEHRERAGRDAQGLASFAINLAASPEFGNVRVAKTDLAHLMADCILADLSERDADEVAKDRPIVATLVAIFRVT
jgi:hypothetical protein